MDRAYELISGGRVIEGMTYLRRMLGDLRASMSPLDWMAYVKREVIPHPIKELIHLCPMTLRSFEKPRGYAGDAVMLDHIYGLGEAKLAPHPATLAGQIYFVTTNALASSAVRYRRIVLARQIDETVERVGDGQAKILSIAAGHLREAELSRAVMEKRTGELIAFDQDEASLDVVRRDYWNLNVRTINGTVRQLLGGKVGFSGCDLVYAAGLFDYLEQPAARCLTETLFNMVRPGGRVLIANFADRMPEAAGMEAFMDWWLVYRTKEQVAELFSGLPQERIGKLEIFCDPDQSIIFATADKLA
jgi:extracellular factor (EF) 3-hydroxypalmitic acid methyl ester biosynthesis protein